MKAILGILLIMSCSFASCIFDRSLDRPICSSANGSRIGWQEYISLSIEQKMSMQNQVMIDLAKGKYANKLMSPSEAKEILARKNITVSGTFIPAPIKKCQSLDFNWKQYCSMMVGEGDWIDCDHVDPQQKADIVSRMWAAQGCVQ